MATSTDPVTSDTEGQEKPVRKQLQKASISRAAGETLDALKASDHASSEGMEVEKEEEEEETKAADVAEDADKAEEPTQQPRKKRSFEEVEEQEMKDRPAARTRSQHTRKRSRDSKEEEDQIHNSRNVSRERKRDIDATEDAETANGTIESASSERAGTPEPKGGKRSEEKVEAMTSPKTKRSRLHSSTEEGEAGTAAPLAGEAPEDVAVSDAAVTDEAEDEKTAEKKSSVAEAKSETTAKSPTVPPGSGFANTSATSPFGAIASPPKSPSAEAQTSPSAFAASGFGSLAGAATSGFGALGKTSGGPAGGWGSKKSLTGSEDGKEKTTSTFGGALGQQSGFGAAAGKSVFSSSGASAFGGSTLGGGSAFGGSGFGSLGGAAGLSSFASGKPSPFTSGSAKPVKPLGAPAADDEEEGEGDDEDGDDNGFKSPLSQESDKQDERFYAQEHETGEEGEVTEFNCRAKLYQYATVDAETKKKEWKERGLGVVRLNVAQPAPPAEDDLEAGTKADDSEAKAASSKVKARLVMRADGSHRLMLNTPVQKDIKFGAVGGGPPQSGFILFMGAVDEGRLEPLQLKLKQANALELYEKIKDLQEAM